MVLRRTCRYELTPNQEMEEKLDGVWMDFSSAMAERGARLSVALMFYRSAEVVGLLRQPSQNRLLKVLLHKECAYQGRNALGDNERSHK